mgnify:CR=1 FL=1
MYKDVRFMDELVFVYKNWRGEVATRTVKDYSFYVGSTEYHEGTQVLMKAWYLNKNDWRIFAVKDIIKIIEKDTL